MIIEIAVSTLLFSFLATKVKQHDVALEDLRARTLDPVTMDQALFSYKLQNINVDPASDMAKQIFLELFFYRNGLKKAGSKWSFVGKHWKTKALVGFVLANAKEHVTAAQVESYLGAREGNPSQ